MDQLGQIGDVLGSLKVLMVFRDEIRINQRQCFLLADAYNMAFDVVTEEIRHNLRFEEKHTKWNALENPLKELQRLIKEGTYYIKQCLEPKDWWAKAISLNQNVDCVGFHLHNLLLCISIVIEAIEIASEISGCDHEAIYKKRLILSKKYEREWIDPKLFQAKFGKLYLVSQEMCSKLDSVSKEDQWILSEAISEKKSSSLTKHENLLAELLLAPKGKLFPVSILLGSKDYQVRRRLGSGSQYKEIQWMGESFVLRHLIIGDVEPLSREISVISSLSHPNVMHFMYAFIDDERKKCFLVTELMNKDLAGCIKEISCTRRRIPFPLIVAVDIMLQIARGMEHLHSRKIYHGDLNPSNILVRGRNPTTEGYYYVKVTGFGLRSVKNLKGSTNYPCIWYAPEVLTDSGAKYSEKADVYSFAMICFELLTGKLPFEDDHLQGDKMNRNIRAGERPLFPFQSPKYLTGLTKRCWLSDPIQRPSFSSICRVLRYIKRFLIMHMDRNPLELPCPDADYFEIEMNLSRRFMMLEAVKVWEVPFQMFAYRVIEREKMSVNLKEKSSESGSEGTSSYGDGNGFNTQDESFASSHMPIDPSPMPLTRSASLASSNIYNKASPRKVDGKAINRLGRSLNERTMRLPPLLSLRGRSLKLRSDSQLTPPAVMTPGRRRISGHKSDSELSSSSSHASLDNYSKESPRKVHGKANKQSGQNINGRVSRPPALLSFLGGSLRSKSNSHMIPPAVMTPGQHRISGHKSDSELT